MNNSEDDSRTLRVALIIAVVALAIGLGLDNNRAQAADVVSEVPTVQVEETKEVVVPEVEDEPGMFKKFFLDKKKAVATYFSREERLEQELKQAQAALNEAIGIQLHHDKQLDAAAAQNNRTVLHFEGLISQYKLEAEAYRLHNQTLDKALKDFQDKDGSLMFVEGCYISRDLGIDITQ